MKWWHFSWANVCEQKLILEVNLWKHWMLQRKKIVVPLCVWGGEGVRWSQGQGKGSSCQLLFNMAYLTQFSSMFLSKNVLGELGGGISLCFFVKYFQFLHVLHSWLTMVIVVIWVNNYKEKIVLVRISCQTLARTHWDDCQWDWITQEHYQWLEPEFELGPMIFTSWGVGRGGEHLINVWNLFLSKFSISFFIFEKKVANKTRFEKRKENRENQILDCDYITSLDDNQHKRKKNVFQHENLESFALFFFFTGKQKEKHYLMRISSLAFYFFGKTNKIKKIF